MSVQDAMSIPALTVGVDESVKGALRLMDQHHVTSLPVIGRQGLLVGVINEADVLRHRVCHDPRAHMMPKPGTTTPAVSVAEALSRPLTMEPRGDLSEAVELMTSTAVKSLPIVEEGSVGVVSRSDVVHLLARQDAQIRGGCGPHAHRCRPPLRRRGPRRNRLPACLRRPPRRTSRDGLLSGCRGRCRGAGVHVIPFGGPLVQLRLSECFERTGWNVLVRGSAAWVRHPGSAAELAGLRPWAPDAQPGPIRRSSRERGRRPAAR
jgi:CBS domain-containing protein